MFSIKPCTQHQACPTSCQAEDLSYVACSSLCLSKLHASAVGFGDVVMTSPLGKAVVLAMIGVGVVLIPVQTSQLYSQLTARRMTLGRPPLYIHMRQRVLVRVI